MPNRFIALLLIIALASQAAVAAPVSVTAHAGGSVSAGLMDSSQMSHGDCAGEQASTPAGNTDCPCCPDVAAAAGCATYCIAALAILPGGLAFTAETGDIYASLMTRPLVTHFDIPPTPPPIA